MMMSTPMMMIIMIISMLTMIHLLKMMVTMMVMMFAMTPTISISISMTVATMKVAFTIVVGEENKLTLGDMLRLTPFNRWDPTSKKSS